jgi:hypothetical protein
MFATDAFGVTGSLPVRGQDVQGYSHSRCGQVAISGTNYEGIKRTPTKGIVHGENDIEASDGASPSLLQNLLLESLGGHLRLQHSSHALLPRLFQRLDLALHALLL